ncbi:hypothetical protein OAX32_03000 [Flavobacteriales bacterium]|nr:hypothetical protein [Flavobacteriales bacterium]
MRELINVIIPAGILGAIVSVIFFLPSLFKKVEAYFKQEDIIDEDGKMGNFTEKEL